MNCRGFESVCTNNEAREYFKNKGLGYSNLNTGRIHLLHGLISEEIMKSNKTGETSTSTMKVSDKIDVKENKNGGLRSAYLYMDSNYFKKRECISFEEEGFIGFAGWADIGNLNPIKRAFMKWCDIIC